MKHELSVPPPSPRSQPEISRASAGHEWNNGITRRSFLKRTGGATLGTIVAWHGLSENLSANTEQTTPKSGDYLWTETQKVAVNTTMEVRKVTGMNDAEIIEKAILQYFKLKGGEIHSYNILFKNIPGSTQGMPKAALLGGPKIRITKYAGGVALVELDVDVEYKITHRK